MSFSQQFEQDYAMGCVCDFDVPCDCKERKARTEAAEMLENDRVVARYIVHDGYTIEQIFGNATETDTEATYRQIHAEDTSCRRCHPIVSDDLPFE